MTFDFIGLDKSEGEAGTLEINEFTEDEQKNYKITSTNPQKELLCYK